MKNIWGRFLDTLMSGIREHANKKDGPSFEGRRITPLYPLIAKAEGAVENWVFRRSRWATLKISKEILGGCIEVWVRNKDKWAKYKNCPTFAVEYRQALADVLEIEKRETGKK